MNEDVSIRRKCIRMLQELAQQEILPPSFVLDGIALDSADPVSGGTFAVGLTFALDISGNRSPRMFTRPAITEEFSE